MAYAWHGVARTVSAYRVRNGTTILNQRSLNLANASTTINHSAIVLYSRIIQHHVNLDEDATVNDAFLPVRLYYLHSEHPGEGFSCRYSSHIKFDIERTYRVIEYFAFDDPDDLGRFVHPLHFDIIMAFDWSIRSIRFGDSQPDVSTNEHLWHSNTFSIPLWKSRNPFHKW